MFEWIRGVINDEEWIEPRHVLYAGIISGIVGSIAIYLVVT